MSKTNPNLDLKPLKGAFEREMGMKWNEQPELFLQYCKYRTLDSIESRLSTLNHYTKDIGDHLENIAESAHDINTKM